jgi:hypothetical protein
MPPRGIFFVQYGAKLITMKKDNQSTKGNSSNASSKTNFDNLSKQADQDRKVKKAGSQSDSSKRHNNGRGGGK